MIADEQGDGLILLEQDSRGNIDRVAIHPLHLRYMAEKMGLIETSDPTAQKTIAALQRRMLALRDRIENLSEWMAKYSDHKHADLSRIAVTDASPKTCQTCIHRLGVTLWGLWMATGCRV